MNRRPRMYSMIEYPGLTVEEQIQLMKKLNIYSPEMETILRWHPKKCIDCDQKYFPSGSLETRCHKCQREYRTKYWRKWKRENRKAYK